MRAKEEGRESPYTGELRRRPTPAWALAQLEGELLWRLIGPCFYAEYAHA